MRPTSIYWGLLASLGTAVGLLSSCLNVLRPVHRFSATAAGPAPDYASPGHLGRPARPVLGGPAAAARPARPRANSHRHGGRRILRAPHHVLLEAWLLECAPAAAPFAPLHRPHYLRNQASLFYGVGRLYAPRYRQATLYPFFAAQDPDSQPALDLAYADVKAAFQYYLAHYNHGRPFILASHSQGTTHLTRLLHELVDDNPPLRKQLIAAYLIGRLVKPDEYQHLPALRDSFQTGGIIAWNTALRGTDFVPYHGLLVTNPLTWTLDSTNAPAVLNQGGVPLNFRRLDPHLTAAQPHRGLLWVDDPHLAGYRRLHVPGFRELRASYHIMDYNMFYLNVRQNARARCGRGYGKSTNAETQRSVSF